MWLRNCWYVIAWDHEIPAVSDDRIFTRTVLNEPIVVYRKADGGLVAMEDRCCHRHAPLSKGRKEGDCIRCGYHGLKFDAAGVCVEAPGIAIVPPKARVRTYPVVEKNRWIFVWMGDEARAHPSLLPDNFSCDHPEWRYRPGYMRYDTPWLLIADNLLDFSHLSYVHEKTLGGSTKIAQAAAAIEELGGPGPKGLRITRRVPGVPPSSLHKMVRTFNGSVDRWFVYDFVLPGTLLMHSGGRPCEDAPDDMSRAVQLHSCQTLTPETDGSTHYFFQNSHRAGDGDETTTESIYQGLIDAFEEDKEVISAQYETIKRDPNRPMLPLAIDAGLARFRRLVEREVVAERAAHDATAPEPSRQLA